MSMPTLHSVGLEPLLNFEIKGVNVIAWFFQLKGEKETLGRLA